MLQFFLSCTILMFYFIFCFFYIFFVHSFHVATFFVLHSFRVAIFFVLHSFDVAIFYVLQSFHVAPSFVLGSFHVAPSFLLHIFFYSTLFMLQFFMLHILQFKPALLNCFLFYSFHGALFCCCFSSHCKLFTLHSSMSHSFHVVPFFSSAFLMLYSFYNALSHGSLPCCVYIILQSFKAALFRIAIFSYCTLSFLCIFSRRTFQGCAIFLLYFLKASTIQFCLRYKLNKRFFYI